MTQQEAVFRIAELSNEYHLNFATFLTMVEMESNFNEKAYNPKDTDNLPAKGISQFKDKTWAKFVKDYDLSYTKDDVFDGEKALSLMAIALNDGMAFHWGTYRTVKDKFGSVKVIKDNKGNILSFR